MFPLVTWNHFNFSDYFLSQKLKSTWNIWNDFHSSSVFISQKVLWFAQNQSFSLNWNNLQSAEFTLKVNTRFECRSFKSFSPMVPQIFLCFAIHIFKYRV